MNGHMRSVSGHAHSCSLAPFLELKYCIDLNHSGKGREKLASSRQVRVVPDPLSPYATIIYILLKSMYGFSSIFYNVRLPVNRFFGGVIGIRTNKQHWAFHLFGEVTPFWLKTTK